jgi:hypothetical protein
MEYTAVFNQLHNPTKRPPKATASSSGGSYYFIYPYQVEHAITDVDIKSKLALRGNAAATKQELGAAGQGTWRVVNPHSRLSSISE